MYTDNMILFKQKHTSHVPEKQSYLLHDINIAFVLAAEDIGSEALRVEGTE